MKYNSIGEQLIAKAKELDPNYKPDKFNDMSEAIDIILNNTGSSNSVPPTLNLFDFENDVLRTTITEEEYNNLKNGLYNSVNYFTETPFETYLPSKLLSVYDDSSESLSCFFSSIKVTATSETDISSTNIIYELEIGQKDTSGNYPITIEEMIEIPFGGIGGGDGGSTNPITYYAIRDFNDGDHDDNSFVMPTGDVVAFIDQNGKCLIGTKKIQDGVISYICYESTTVIGDGLKYKGFAYKITKSNRGYNVGKADLTEAFGINFEFLPDYSRNDNGKVLSVINGKANWANASGGGQNIEDLPVVELTSEVTKITDETVKAKILENVNNDNYLICKLKINLLVPIEILITRDTKVVPSDTIKNTLFTTIAYINLGLTATTITFMLSIDSTDGTIGVVYKIFDYVKGSQISLFQKTNESFGVTTDYDDTNNINGLELYFDTINGKPIIHSDSAINSYNIPTITFED